MTADKNLFVPTTAFLCMIEGDAEGNLTMAFAEEVDPIARAGWKVGDKIIWFLGKDGNALLKKMSPESEAELLEAAQPQEQNDGV